ncbi:MAG: ABC transporter ATP-binding protein [Candidatus Marinimicrobia bacterium]|nr:ABC transporter ATP-binding protein [Candidatus Neomarinimicrobiota bacterium]
MPLLEVDNLSVRYGSIKAITDVSFHVEQGEIVAIVGPNGVGKSTALNALSGIIESNGGLITSGEVRFEGHNITGFKTHELVQQGISLVPEGRRIFPRMTVIENLEMGAFTIKDKSIVNNEIQRMLDLFPLLKDRTLQQAGTLSTGEQQMLALGRSLIIQPKLLLADEPSLGLSPNFVDMIFEKLVEINSEGTSILLVEQNARMALEACHRGYVFEMGKISFDGKKDSLVNDERVQKSYLGK